MSLRVGVVCAVLDDRQQILLSKREDLQVWNLPGGRLDPHERITSAAAREVFEETGIEVEVERLVGLYYLDGWQRMNFLCVARPTGGALRQGTDETVANAYFPVDRLPEPLLFPVMIEDAVSGKAVSRVLESAPGERRQVKLRLALRWLQNLLAGRPEPRFPQFGVYAAAVIWDEERRSLYCEPGGSWIETEPGLNLPFRWQKHPVLPRTRCDGSLSPQQHLARHLGQLIDAEDLQWIGVWHNIALNVIELVYTATLSSSEPAARGRWQSPSAVQGARGRNQLYIQRERYPIYGNGAWLIEADELAFNLS